MKCPARHTNADRWGSLDPKPHRARSKYEKGIGVSGAKRYVFPLGKSVLNRHIEWIKEILPVFVSLEDCAAAICYQ